MDELPASKFYVAELEEDEWNSSKEVPYSFNDMKGNLGNGTFSRNRDKFQGNPRMAQMYRTWDRMNEDHKNNVIKSADEFLNGLN